MKKSCTHQEQAGMVLSQQDDKEEDKRWQVKFAELGSNKSHNFYIKAVAEPSFDIRTLITPPTHVFNSFHHILYIDIYYLIICVNFCI